MLFKLLQKLIDLQDSLMDIKKLGFYLVFHK
jgi:hypothetical protein